MDSGDYNSAQRAVIDLLGADARTRPNFDPGLRDELRAHLETHLAPLFETLSLELSDDEGVYVSKFMLNQVMGCEQKFLAQRDETFEWSPPVARGTIAHKAIELSLHWRKEPVPLDLVDEAVASLEQSDKSIADYLTGCREVERAELRAEAARLVTHFMECFPPLKPQWRPVTDSPIRAELLEGRVILSGKPDLTLGRPEGDVAGKVIIDFKTGNFSPSHREDLRFYALVEALRILPPRLLATYYLDQAQTHTEEVSRDLLAAATQRVVDGVDRYLDLLHRERPATLSPGPACRWCPLLHDCETGAKHLDDDADSPELL
ncbi:MAG: PD-(D/E)XK nuclease family protein [Acidimicrobiaceae bacterium]|nr:PD-(D/E)XK nuclease family protein [Acidimicrobiaceae bacterium]MCY4175614.1 PD-(D/E)XK nuclease family protein [Acidimicrobiaceae bacterium]MCY4279342.1 PD-(D/E)XK nuclease family protein [Acidimicrobiaceae bacterium]MCY4294983.1 PD-(D/E)XK nuclease family protein [Acidimicrobiaceae bacterium]